MKIVGRLGATIVGLFATVIALIINFVFAFVTRAGNGLFGGNLPESHGFIGLALILVAFVGSLLAVPKPRTAATLMLIGAAGFYYPVHGYAIITAPFYLIAAALAFFDRTPVKA